MPEQLRFECKPEVLGLRGDRNTNLYDEIKRGLWPPPIKLGRRSLWLAHESQAVLGAIAAGASDEQRRQLVRELVSQRSTLMPSIGEAA